jgi:hypothetical protein
MRQTSKIGISLLAAGGLMFAQSAPDNGGWKRVGDSNPAYASNPAQDVGSAQPQGVNPNGPPPPPPPSYNVNVPPTLTINSGTFLTVRINQALSSDRNQQGDAFTATLVRPVVVDGFVVAQAGETIAGHVVEAQKAGRVSGVSHLAIQLTDLTLADGQQVPIQSQLITRTGSTSTGRDATAIGTTTAVGAVAGAAGAGGEGAAIGAGAGALAGTIGVLLTRGHATYVTPESVLTFRIESPVTVATDRAPQAFRVVQPGDYNQPSSQPTLRTRAPGGYPPPGPYYYGAAYPYPYYYGPGFYGPGVVIGFGGGGRFGRRR